MYAGHSTCVSSQTHSSLFSGLGEWLRIAVDFLGFGLCKMLVETKRGGGDFYLPFSSRPSTALWLGLITLSTWVWARFPAAVPDLIFHVGAAPLQANSPSSQAHWLTGSIFLLAGPLTNICFESLFYLTNHIHLSSYLYHYSWLILKHQDCFIS